MKSKSISTKVGRPIMAQPNTYFRLTQDRHMQGTRKNLTFVVGCVRCAITKKACASGVRRFGFGVHPGHLPMQCRGPGCGGRLGTTIVQSSFNHFTRQPQSILWHVQYALDSASRQGTMQCQETCWMVTDTIKLPDEGGMRVCKFQMQGQWKHPKSLPTSSAVVVECLLARQSNPQQPTPLGLPRQCVAGDIGGQT